MEAKKNPNADLRKNSGLYLEICLAEVMALVYGALEWKTYYEANKYDISLNVEEQLYE
jgi:protein TonB